MVPSGNPPYQTSTSTTESSNPTTSPNPSGPTTHRANCQCGHTRFKVTLPEPFPTYKINRCTCSVCTKNGYLLVYPTREKVEWVSGFEDLGEYRFATKKKIHKFCKRCGSSIMIDFCLTDDFPGEPEKDKVAINARMFTDVDFENDDLAWTLYDGMHKMFPKYDPGEFWRDVPGEGRKA